MKAGRRKRLGKRYARLESMERIGCHAFRHCLITHLLEAEYDIRTIQELLSYEDVKTTMIYTVVLDHGSRGVRSPLDLWRFFRTALCT